MEYSKLDDKELYQLIEKADLADRLTHSSEWRLLDEAAKRIVDRAVAEFALRADVSDVNKLIELKVIIKKYKYGLFDELKQLAIEGEHYFNEVMSRQQFRADIPE